MNLSAYQISIIIEALKESRNTLNRALEKGVFRKQTQSDIEFRLDVTNRLIKYLQFKQKYVVNEDFTDENTQQI